MRLSQRRGLMVWPGPELEGIPKVPSQSSDGGGPSTLSQQDENADRVARSGLGTGSSKSLKRAATSREKMTPPTKKSRSPSATEILLSFKKDALSPHGVQDRKPIKSPENSRGPECAIVHVGHLGAIKVVSRVFFYPA